MTDPVMDDRVRATLSELVRTRGLATIADDPSRCRAFLLDLCPERQAEVSVLVAAAEERLPQVLSSAPAPELRVESAVNALVTTRGISPSAARWAVTSWLDAVAPGTEPLPRDTSDADGERRNPLAWSERLAALVVGLLLLVGAGFWLWGGDGPPGVANDDEAEVSDADDTHEDDRVDPKETDEPDGEPDDTHEDDRVDPKETDEPDGEPDDTDVAWSPLVETFPAASSESCRDTTSTFDGAALRRIGCDFEDGVLADYLDWPSSRIMADHVETARAGYELAYENEWNDAEGATGGTLMILEVQGGHQLEWTVASEIQSARVFVPETVAPTAEAVLDYWAASPVTVTRR